MKADVKMLEGHGAVTTHTMDAHEAGTKPGVVSLTSCEGESDVVLCIHGAQRDGKHATVMVGLSLSEFKDLIDTGREIIKARES